MILHLVLFRLKPGVAADDSRLLRVTGAMDGLPGRIPEIRLWQHGRHLAPGGVEDPLAWDYGLLAGFADEAALLAYFDHPEHGPVLSVWEEIAELAYCDLNGGIGGKPAMAN
ncbi:MAG: Dabb family protein [Rhodocyclaceae bacterium]|nr:Dabb family protein [Rhodocyclaceae bacterium]